MTTIVMFVIFCTLFTTISIIVSTSIRKKFPAKRYDIILDYVILFIGIGTIFYHYQEHYWTRTSLMFITLLTLLWIGITFAVHLISKLTTIKKVERDKF